MVKMAGERATWIVLGALAVAALIQPVSCGPDGPVDDDATTAQAQAVLTSVGPAVVEPTLSVMHDRSLALAAAVQAWDDAVVAGESSDAARSAARDAWWQAIDQWQRAEVMQIGPAAPVATAVAGRDLRDMIYSWPTVNPCRVDQETVRQDWGEPDFFESARVNVRGLDALEYLLYAGPDNACPSQVDINASGEWDALGDDGVRARRSAYAVALADRLVEDVQILRAAWAPDGEDFGAELAAAGEDGSVYDSQQQALNAVYDALFYVETRTKDRKLALPLGLRDCSGEQCAEQVESPMAGGSLAWVEANLHGFDLLFHGGDQDGLADLLVALGHEGVVASIDADLQAAIDEVASHDVPFDALVRSDPDAALRVHDALKALTDHVKGDLATLLALQIPSEAAGDND